MTYLKSNDLFEKLHPESLFQRVPRPIIIADHLMPTQIRISNLIARSPDEMEKTDRAERASIKDGQIVIEPIERQDKTI